MTRYATVSIDERESETDSQSTDHTAWTDELGCSATSVDGYRVPADGEIPLPAASEQVCIPVESDGPIHLDETPVPSAGLGRVPAGLECTVRCSTPTVLVVVGAPAEPAADDEPVAVAFDECEFATPSTSSIHTARLTARLGCAGMKLNARILEPGQHVPYHTEGTQEELFVPIRGPATMRIDDTTYETPVGTVTRVGPPVPRSAINDGDVEALWVMIGAPPTGGPEEWDPGAEMLE